MRIRIKSLGGSLPAYETPGSAGMDLRACIDAPMIIEAGGRALVPTGLCIQLPAGVEAQIRARSGLSARHGVGLVNGVGTIDSDYRGEIMVAMINWGEGSFRIDNGDRIAQMVIARHERAEWDEAAELEETERGDGGFGHTGV
ncbi:MAG: dUTP diphosphatase [Clostridiales Family XIII bacterium]|jgi:dUTP pyrophosphatase|nr:dUTP diphosphatase [Clostridiales Family XIII bacterium]